MIDFIIKKITIWNLLIIASILFIFINIFIGNNDANFYHSIIMVLSIGFDRIEKILEGK